MQTTAFFAYPDRPAWVGGSVTKAVELLDVNRELIVRPWSSLNVFGFKIDKLIRDQILSTDLLIADITFPNFNVYYEIGFCIASNKPFLLTVNKAIEKANQNVNLTGLFDTIGQVRYQNAEELSIGISQANPNTITPTYYQDRNYTQPLFILDMLMKTDFRNYIFQSATNTSIQNRSYDPVEIPRFSLSAAISDISSSAGVIVPLISEAFTDALKHNLRAAFISGLSHGFGIDPLIIQYEDSPAPLDYRDFVTTARTRREVQQKIEEYCNQTLILNQKSASRPNSGNRSIIEQIDIGSPAAENEFQRLDEYFVRTAEFSRALRSSSSIIVGRKGSGKSAIFFQLILDKSENKKNVIVELKPASHNLSELRESLMSISSVGVFDHTISSFWQYMIYMEILLRLREIILPRAKYHLNLLNKIKNIEEKFQLTDEIVSGDFTSRLEIIVSYVVKNIEGGNTRIDVKEKITNAMFENKIPDLREAISDIASDYDEIFLLFDNIDKGWPARQVEVHDIRTVRHLIGILNRIQRDLERKKIVFKYAIFLRSDVYEQLVEETSDRGKYNVIKVDWSDPIQLEHLLKKRVEHKFDPKHHSAAWSAVSPVNQLIQNSLVRPRFLIESCEKALSFAINRGTTV